MRAEGDLDLGSVAPTPSSMRARFTGRGRVIACALRRAGSDVDRPGGELMRGRLATVLAAGVVALALPAAASAGTIAVTSNADSGSGSLRAALAAAGSGDTITIPPMTITLTSGELPVIKGVVIKGSGAGVTTVSGNDSSGVFDVQAPGVTIEDLTITKGHSAGDGGGVFTNSGLTLSHVAIVNNTAGSGGGVSDSGVPPLVIDHSLIAHNQAPSGAGGGIFFSGGPGSSITNTTIAANTASSAAGGIYFEASGMTLNFDALVGNILTGAAGQGGNLRVGGNFSMTMGNTIIAGGVAAAGGDCYMASQATWTSLGHNAEDTDATPDQGGPNTCQFYFTGPGDRTKLTLKLGALQDNGGPTGTIAPQPGSPVLDQADNASCPTDDQRGVTRPQGSGCDIGPVELSVPTSSSGFADTLTPNGAVLHGTANTQGLGGAAHYLYGPTPSFGALTPNAQLNAIAVAQPTTATLSGLVPNTTYYFALVVSTADGTVTGPTSTLTTPAASPSPSLCKVPKLKGDSLVKAKRALSKAHCSLGKVTRPKHSHGKLVVFSQRARAGSTHPTGFKVGVKLGTQPPKKRHN